MEFCRMHGTAAVEQHATMIEVRGEMFTRPLGRHHAGTRIRNIVQTRDLFGLFLPGCTGMGPDKAAATFIHGVDLLVTNEAFEPAI